MILENALLVVAGTLTSMVAGLLFAFSVAVNGGLHRLKDAEYLRAMQSINVAILNPIFLVTFLAPVFLLPLTAYLHLGLSTVQFGLLLTAALIYIVAVFGLTMGGNVPLNNRLMRLELARATDEQVVRARAQYERPWNRLHTIRTVASIGATVLLFTAALF